MALEDRIGVLAVVLVAVIERECREGARAAVLQAVGDGVERNDVEARFQHGAHDRFEKFRRHAQNPVRLEILRRIGANLMQHENHAVALSEGRKNAFGSGIVNRRERSLEKLCGSPAHASTSNARMVQRPRELVRCHLHRNFRARRRAIRDYAARGLAPWLKRSGQLSRSKALRLRPAAPRRRLSPSTARAVPARGGSKEDARA